MELIRINDKKIKIMLTPTDMKMYELDVQKLSRGEEECRRAFRHMLHDAGIGGEAPADMDKIYVQYYPSREGGCEMFITKLDLAEEVPLLKEKEMMQPMEAKEEERWMAYRFDSLANLLLGCRYLLTAILGTTHAKSVSEAYEGDGNSFYLIVRVLRPEIMAKKCAYLLGEVGTQVLPASNVRAYISEHGRPLCTYRAIETLGNL